MPKFVELHWKGRRLAVHADVVLVVSGDGDYTTLLVGSDQCEICVDESYEEAKAKLEAV